MGGNLAIAILVYQVQPEKRVNMKTKTILSTAILIISMALSAASPLADDPGYNYINVTTMVDEYDITDNGYCSLREAITAATTNTATGGCPAGSDSDWDIIEIPIGTFPITREGIDDTNDSGDFDIDQAVSDSYLLYLEGAGNNSTFIDGLAHDRIFDIAAGSKVMISHMTITNGQSQTGDVKSGQGGGIYNAGTLNLWWTKLNVNTAGRGTMSSQGGGIFNTGGLIMKYSTIEGNMTLNGFAGGHGGGGGGIYNTGAVNIEESTISNNTTGNSGDWLEEFGSGGNGGGIYNEGDLTVTTSTLQGNQTGSGFTYYGHGGHGGGLYNSGTASLDKCTLDHNSTGGSIYKDGGSGAGIYSNGTLSISNVTISKNVTGVGGMTSEHSGAGGDGGGIYINNDAGGTTEIHQSTIAYNDASVGWSLGVGGGIYSSLYSSTLMTQSILAYNTINAGPNDCYAVLTSDSDYNLFSNYESGICPFVSPAIGNLFNLDPMLGSLQMNGGLTETHRLMFNSPAIDSASTSCYSAEDQRGELRPFDGNRDGLAECDMGAYEFNMEFVYFAPVIIKP